ncbi:MAG: 23S rRNA (uracil(1939)-C(5))-methyltransferase RlmD, partial [Clostridia bacterium]|nr:23S rRNA (uracil(1939)-C(5))-methyltransferase RlmD [Clostridia bacterium]
MADRTEQVKTSGKSIWFRCPQSETCGGCQLLKLPYSAQLRKKQEWVESLLSAYGSVQPIIGMENPKHYRNKVHAVFALDRARKPVSGVYAAGTHHVVPVRHCLIENEKADQIIASIVDLLPSFPWSIYNEHTHRGLLRHVVVRVSETTSQVMVTLVTTSLEYPQQERFVEQLLRLHPDITTIVLNANPRQTSAVLGTQEKVIYGPGYIEDLLCGKRFRISSRSFYQVNSRQTEILYNTAIDLCQLTGTETILDAYCGTGTIGICASDRAKQIIGVEINGKAVADAKINAEINQVKNAAFYTGDAGNYIAKLAAKNILPDLVIMDPPRSGCSDLFLNTVCSMSPKKLLYISCNPESLARDLQSVLSRHYHVDAIIPVDMFPGTQHVETVLLMSQQKPDDTIHVGIDLKPEDVTVAESKATYAELQAYIEEKY